MNKVGFFNKITHKDTENEQYFFYVWEIGKSNIFHYFQLSIWASRRQHSYPFFLSLSFSPSRRRCSRRRHRIIALFDYMSLTEEELEVALTLESLPELVLASVHRAALHVLPDSLRWGSRKPRSLPGHPLMPSPPPPLRDGEKNDDGGVTATATSSPSTPLSFQGSEDIDVRPKPWVEHRKQYIKVSVPSASLSLSSQLRFLLYLMLAVSSGWKNSMRRWLRLPTIKPISNECVLLFSFAILLSIFSLDSFYLNLIVYIYVDVYS